MREAHLIHDDHIILREVRVSGELSQEQTLRKEENTSGQSPTPLKSHLWVWFGKGASGIHASQ